HLAGVPAWHAIGPARWLACGHLTWDRASRLAAVLADECGKTGWAASRGARPELPACFLADQPPPLVRIARRSQGADRHIVGVPVPGLPIGESEFHRFCHQVDAIRGGWVECVVSRGGGQAGDLQKDRTLAPWRG